MSREFVRELQSAGLFDAAGLMTLDATAAASESDRKWFEAHPGEDVRYRDLIPGELPLPELPGGLEERLPASAFIVQVNQIGPGLRARQIVAFCYEPEELGW